MTQKKIIPVKYFYYGMLGCVLFIGTVFFYLWQKESKEEKLLEEKGVLGEAWVLNLTSSKTSRKASANYYMEVAFFADTASKPIAKDTIRRTSKNADDIVKSIGKITEDITRPLGNYQTLKIPINLNDYNKYHINDKVKIKYVKDDPTIIKLIREK
jgi:hypothetical protein